MSLTAMRPAIPRLSTPALIWAWFGAVVALAILAGAVSLGAARSSAEAARTIGRDAEPSVALGLDIAATLGATDAFALADSLTDNGGAVGTSAPFRKALLHIGDDSIEAARNITYGEDEAIPLRRLGRFVQMYEEAVVEARTTPAGNGWLLGRRLAWASRVARELAAPQARALADVNAARLNEIYDGYQGSATIQIVAVAVGYLLLLGGLVGLQIWLARRMRRLVNPLLVVASVVVVGGGVWVVSAIAAQRSDLRTAKADAYDSLSALFQAKSYAYALRADVSRWLVDPDDRVAAASAIAGDFAALARDDFRRADVRAAVTKRLNEALALETAGEREQAAAHTPDIGGLLGAELGNVTFGVDERKPASASVEMLMYFAQTVGSIQAVERGGDHAKAARDWLSERPGGGGEAVALLVDAIDRTIAVNQTQFDRHAGAALASMATIPWIIALSLLAAPLLALGGLWPRLAEYR